ncbi:unnamed protein product [Bursaphelenchus xylophilus]|uniref:(pine wood nematode) hypothetical protein n=1 Tax=Bursaphelenchus xylophilus TaxID=6326 RepID=A0A1I7SLS2_BURXY|nr:unnamed protein product [Bursaphelenchus xylophilus]CAG9129718.1 unnamed protein product [Bursaphelenchus xylophilus]
MSLTMDDVRRLASMTPQELRERCNNDLAVLNTLRNEVDHHVETAKRQKAFEEEAVTGLIGDLQKVAKDRAEVSNRKEALVKEVNTLRAQLSGKQEQVKVRLQKKLEARQAKENALNGHRTIGELEDLKALSDAKFKELTELELAVTEKRKRNKQVEVSIKECEIRIAEKKEKVEELQKTDSCLGEDLEQFEERAEQLRVSIEEASAKIADAKKKMTGEFVDDRPRSLFDEVVEQKKPSEDEFKAICSEVRNLRQVQGALKADLLNLESHPIATGRRALLSYDTIVGVLKKTILYLDKFMNVAKGLEALGRNPTVIYKFSREQMDDIGHYNSVLRTSRKIAEEVLGMAKKQMNQLSRNLEENKVNHA